MLWHARLRRHLGTGRAGSWHGPSRFGAAGITARQALRRAAKPVLSREDETHRLVERVLAERALGDRIAALANDPPAPEQTLSVDSDVGRLLLHADDEVITPTLRHTGTWEPEEGAWLRSVIRPGDTVVDCGANVGYFSLLASRATGPAGAVVAIEPEDANLRLLRANLWRNGADNVWVVPAAAADARGLLALRRNPSNKGDHQVHSGARAGDVLVPSLALDDLLRDVPVDVVKIDTQGVDHLVVAGLAETIAANPGVRVLVEFWIDGMAARGVPPEHVLAGYRALGRPIGLLDTGGVVRPAQDPEIVAAALDWDGHWVNLVLGAAG